MPLINEVSGNVLLQKPNLGGKAYIFEEIFTGSTTNFQPTFSQDQIKLFEQYGGELYIIGASASAPVNIVFKNGTTPSTGFQIQLVTGVLAYQGDNTRAIFLAKGTNPALRLAINVTGACFLQFAILVNV
jgi:hypothetical protein